MTIKFTGEIWYWRGPAPHHFVTVPPEESAEIKAVERAVTYGWGMIPAVVRIGETEWETSLWPKNEEYIVPIKLKIRKVLSLEEGDRVSIRLEI